MQQRYPNWEQLPEAERGHLLVEWLRELLDSDEGELLLTEMNQNEEKTYATNSISQEDLIFMRPDLSANILLLSDAEMQGIANRVGEIIKDEYWSAVASALSASFDEP